MATLKPLIAILGAGALFLGATAFVALLLPGRAFAEPLLKAVQFLAFAAVIACAIVGFAGDRTRN